METNQLPHVAAPFRVRDPLTITIVGATGDLTQRKLMPALFANFAQGFLPPEFAIVGFARRDYTDDTFRAFMADALRRFCRRKPDERKLEDFLAHVFYHCGDADDPAAFGAYAARIAERTNWPANRLFYLSVRPELFSTVLERMHGAGLIHPPRGPQWTRVVIEKPFGRDLASAMDLNRTVRTHLDESQVYRIDHFLGKETVQNILSFRFANSLFEPLFNNHLVDHIQITASETVGMESGRGAYYDATGALRDMVQNHMLQLLCLVAMDPPASLTAEAIRNEKLKVLQAILPPRPDLVGQTVVRGQYVGSETDAERVPGYTQEERVAPDSRTESYVALKLEIQNWRWVGVPVFLRTGKRMAKRMTEISIQFKSPPLQLFQTVECVGDYCDLTRNKPNQIIFRIQPDEGIELSFSAKRPAMQVQVEEVAMDFSYSDKWKKDLPEAYERLLLDVMRGDSTLFTRSDEVEAAWRIIDPILHAWQTDRSLPLAKYAPGSWGPFEADTLLAGHIDGWHRM